LFFPPAFFSKRTRNDLRATNNRPAGKVGRPRILLLFGLKLLMQMSLHDSLSELKLLMQITLHGILVQNQHPRFFTRNDCFFTQNGYFFTCGSFAENNVEFSTLLGMALFFYGKHNLFYPKRLFFYMLVVYGTVLWVACGSLAGRLRVTCGSLAGRMWGACGSLAGRLRGYSAQRCGSLAGRLRIVSGPF
jgi:hypothetical protein